MFVPWLFYPSNDVTKVFDNDSEYWSFFLQNCEVGVFRIVVVEQNNWLVHVKYIELGLPFWSLLFNSDFVFKGVIPKTC